MGNVLGSNGSSSGGLLSGITGGIGNMLDFAEHPLDTIMLFIGGIMFLFVIYHILTT